MKQKLNKIAKNEEYVSVHSNDDAFVVMGYLKKECDTYVVRNVGGCVRFKNCKTLLEAAKHSWYIWL